MMIESKSNYPFITMSTDQSDKKGTHWWSFLELHTKKEIFLFDSFGFEGFKEFILDDDRKCSTKYSTVLKNLTQEITLITFKFAMLEYEKIRKKIDWLILQLIYYS